MQNQKFRYPGFKPFSTNEQNQFFGREKDTEALFKIIKYQAHVVLFGKSGLGKSSLIQAGILPLLEENNYIPIQIRFGYFDKEENRWPLLKLYEKLPFEQASLNLMQKLKGPEDSLWLNCKNLQLRYWQEKKVFPRFLLIFDQFEELFSYHNGVEEFSFELFDLINDNKPRIINQKIKQLFAQGSGETSNDDFELLEEPLRVKALFSIREDQISLLHKFEKQFPTIFQHRYELLPLTRKNAQDAITEPALLETRTGEIDFRSDCFTFQETALSRILNQLDPDNTNTIEPFHLQLFCQVIESKVISQNLKTVSLNDVNIGELKKGLESRYDDFVKNIGNAQDQKAVSYLFEKGFILLPEKRRLSLYEEQLFRDYKISKELLENLVDSGYVRVESSPKGGLLYELGHDVLIAPILSSKERKSEVEKKIRNRYLIALALFLGAALLFFTNYNVQENEREKQQRLSTYFKISKSLKDGNNQVPKDTLRHILNHETLDRRIQLLKTIQGRSDRDSVILEEVVSLLSDEKDTIQITALEVLEKQFTLKPKYLDSIVQLINSNVDTQVRQKALEVLGTKKLTPGTITYKKVYDLIENTDQPLVSSKAILALSKQDSIPPKLIRYLYRLLNEQNEIRIASLEALGNFSNLKNNYHEKILGFINLSYSPEVRLAALEALGNQDSLSLPHQYKIRSIAEDTAFTEVDRVIALNILGNQKNLKEFLVTFASIAFNNRNSGEIRKAAMLNLARQNALAPKYLNNYIRIAQNSSEDISIRSAALRSLSNQDLLGPSYLKLIGSIAVNSSNALELRISAINLLGEQENLGPDALKQLSTCLREGRENSLRIVVLKALGKQPLLDSEYLNEMKKFLSATDSKLRLEAVNSFRNQEKLATSYLEEILKNLYVEDKAIQKAAVEVLKNQEDLGYKFRKKLELVEEEVIDF